MPARATRPARKDNMGDFSYAQPSDFNTGYGFEAGFDSNPAGPVAGYQQELEALIPQGIPLLAAVLLEMGVIDQASLDAALGKQAETGDSLAQILLDEGFAAPDQLVQALQTRALYQ